MNIKACIFDLDGVIVDTAKYHFLAWKSLASKLGFEFTAEHNEQLKGISRMDSLEFLLKIGGIEGLSDDEKLAYAAEKNTLYLSYIETMTPGDILPNVKEFLLDLRKNGVKISLGSASKNAEFILKRLDLMSYFDAIVDGRHISKAKPDPEVFLRGAKALEIQAVHCVVFEDAQAGVKAAKNANMACVGIGSATILSEADFVMPGFQDFTYAKLIQVFK